jgi:hypothetical protein
MPRIDPAAVLAACRQFPKFKVVTHGFGDCIECGCPLSLLALSLGHVPSERCGSVLLFLIKHCEYDIAYLNGFWQGVDAADTSLSDLKSDHEGYADGTATRELLVREGVLM